MSIRVSLRASIAGEDEFSVEEAETTKIEGEALETEIIEAHFSRIELPMFSLEGIQRPRTMKFRGLVDENEVVVLIDSGASHNFVSSNLVQQMKKTGDVDYAATMWPLETHVKFEEAEDNLQP